MTLIICHDSTALCTFKSDIIGNDAGPGNSLPSILIHFYYVFLTNFISIHCYCYLFFTILIPLNLLLPRGLLLLIYLWVIVHRLCVVTSVVFSINFDLFLYAFFAVSD